MRTAHARPPALASTVSPRFVATTLTLTLRAPPLDAPALSSRLAADLRGGDPVATHAAAVRLRRLAVAAEGPGAPFTATRRGQQLLRLIHIVVQNVGLEDKVGALTALRLLKADDTLLQKLLKAGVLPPLVALLAVDDDAGVSSRDASDPARAAAAVAAAARCLEAFSSSADALTTLLRGGVVETASKFLCRHDGEVAQDGFGRGNIFPADGGDDDVHASETRRWLAAAAESCVVALSRVSGSNLAQAASESAFDVRGAYRGVAPLDPRAAASSSSASRSFLCLLESDVTVAHAAAAAGLARMVRSGRAGRAAVAQCGSVLPLMTAALAGNPTQRAAALSALAALAEGTRDGAHPANGSLDATMDEGDVDGDGNEAGADDEDEQITEMDDGGGVHGAGDAAGIAARAAAASTTAVNAKSNASATAGVLGTAAKVGENFFARLIGVLARLLALRGPLERAAADASLALWALAWQPSNRAAMTPLVVDPLVAMYEEGGDAAAEDAGATLSVLARMDARARERVETLPAYGPALLRHLLEHAEASDSPRASPKGGAANNFFRQREAAFDAFRADEEGGAARRGDTTGSPNIRRTISGGDVVAAIARASPQ